MTTPTGLWPRERWAAVATYAEWVDEILCEAIKKLEEVKAWDGDDAVDPYTDEPVGIDPSENEFLAPYHVEVVKCIAEMRRVSALFEGIPELPTGDKIIRDSDGKPVSFIPRPRKK